jgi:outer membrane protein TolC
MRIRLRSLYLLTIALAIYGIGCRSQRSVQSTVSRFNPLAYVTTYDENFAEQNSELGESAQPTDAETKPEESSLQLVSLSQPEYLPLPEGEAAGSDITLDDVIDSVYRAYPALRAALYNRNIAQGQHLSAQGNFDTKFKGATQNQPLGFYENYRHGLGLEQPTYWGGEVFTGYRIGRGFFEPWYQERPTNLGGEFKAGVSIPLWRNRNIDQRRAELWSTAWQTHRVEPQIQAELLDFVLMASDAYWSWVAAGQIYQIQKQLLELATARNAGIEREVELGARDPPDLQDNRRLIVSREAKVISALQKFQQASYKLSIFLRDAAGDPLVLSEDQLPKFPALDDSAIPPLESDIQVALGNRPELQELEFQRKQLQIELNLARNDALPSVDAVIIGSDDVGEPTSSKKDKSETVLEAGIQVEVPLQRRKARGKQQSVAGKLSQLVVKRGLMQDKIVAEVQNVHAALLATYETVQKAREAVELARYMADVERQKFEAGASDLLTLNLREQQSATAAEAEVEALLEYFRAKAVYRAVLAQDHQNQRGL